MGQLTITIFIKLSKSFSQLFNLRFWNSRCNISQSGLSQFSLMNICFHVLYHYRVQLNQIVLFISLGLDPWVLKSFLCSKSYICWSFKQFVDDIFCIIWNLVPNFIFHGKWAMQNIVDNIFVLFSAKWRFTTKHNIHNNPNWPYVTLCSITTFQNFRSNIVWCSIRFIHDFIWNYPFRKTKIY